MRAHTVEDGGHRVGELAVEEVGRRQVDGHPEQGLPSGTAA